MKRTKYFLPVALMLFFFGCLKQKFYPDPNDPGLSKFTFRQYLTGTCYINDTVYINYWTNYTLSPSGLPFPTLTREVSDSTDSIEFSWPIRRREGGTITPGKYRWISFSIPVHKNFTLKELKNWNGEIFRSISLYLNRYPPNVHLSGSGSLYFVKIENSGDTDQNKLYMSGLFNGAIGDSIFIKKGRFDYIVKVNGF